MAKQEFQATYIVLFCNAKHPPDEFDEDLKIFRLSLDQVAASQAARTKTPNDYTAFVGFEYGKKRIVAVHILAQNIELERHVERSNIFVGEYEYIRFWHARRSALFNIESPEKYDRYKEYVRSLSKQTTSWGNVNGEGKKN